MSNECTNESCDTTKQNTNCGSNEECCDLPEKLIGLADEAWFEVLKDKVKKEIESSCGETLDKLAQVVAQANSDRWAHKIQGKVKCDEFKSNVKELLVSCSCDKK